MKRIGLRALPTLLALALLLGVVAAWAQSAGNGGCVVRTPSLQGGYVGECVAGLAGGRGRASGVDRYEGTWRDGQPTGYGVYTFADGRRFEGEFVDGQVHGRARFYFENGDVLEGLFRENRLVGAGRLLRASGGEALSVEWRDSGLVPVAAAPVATPPAPLPPVAVAGAVPWSPRLDLEDFFPAYLLAIASLNENAGGAAARGIAPARMQSGADLSGFSLPVRAAPEASARMVGKSDEHYLGDLWGLVGIRVRTTHPGSVVSVHVAIDEIAEPTQVTFTLNDAGEYDLFPRIRYRYDKLRTILQPMPVNVSWQVSVNGQDAGTQSRVARVRSVQDAPIAAETPRGVEDLSWVFAGFVTEDAAWLDDLIQKAFAGARHGPVGYQGDEDEVSKQVEAVYEYLRRSGVRYSSITTSSGASKKVASQIVRFPSDSVRTAQANCIDGTVLMASILRKMDIEPLIILGPGHAMLGYFTQRDPAKGFIVVETTAIGVGDFAFALRKGQEKYEEWATKEAKNPAFKRIPVFAARDLGVMPIPR